MSHAGCQNNQSKSEYRYKGAQLHYRVSAAPAAGHREAAAAVAVTTGAFGAFDLAIHNSRAVLAMLGCRFTLSAVTAAAHTSTFSGAEIEKRLGSTNSVLLRGIPERHPHDGLTFAWSPHADVNSSGVRRNCRSRHSTCPGGRTHDEQQVIARLFIVHPVSGHPVSIVCAVGSHPTVHLSIPGVHAYSLGLAHGGPLAELLQAAHGCNCASDCRHENVDAITSRRSCGIDAATSTCWWSHTCEELILTDNQRRQRLHPGEPPADPARSSKQKLRAVMKMCQATTLLARDHSSHS